MEPAGAERTGAGAGSGGDGEEAESRASIVGWRRGEGEGKRERV